METNTTLQQDELEALGAIYGSDFTIEDEFIPTFSIVVHVGELEDKEATLVVSYRPEYPNESPPFFHLSIPWMRGAQKQRFSAELEQIYLENIGKPIVYNWVERLRELLHANIPECVDSVGAEPLPIAVPCPLSIQSTNEDALTLPVPQFVTGEAVTDRKSTFQAHIALVSNPGQVKVALNHLLQNKRLTSATHNMYAYRIFDDQSKISWQDCDDDGETHGGTRLLHLLQILNCRNILVVVSRWYGGIMLHGDRFKHINNVARKLIHDEGLV